MKTPTIITMEKGIRENFAHRNNTGWTGRRGDDPTRRVIRSAAAVLRKVKKNQADFMARLAAMTR